MRYENTKSYFPVSPVESTTGRPNVAVIRPTNQSIGCFSVRTAVQPSNDIIIGPPTGIAAQPLRSSGISDVDAGGVQAVVAVAPGAGVGSSDSLNLGPVLETDNSYTGVSPFSMWTVS